MIYDLSKIAGFIVKTVEYDVTLTGTFNKRFIEGLWFGIFSSMNLKRRRGKKEYELGRACSFALIVKNVFAQTEELGLSALTKDNFFFGNNPGETSNKDSIPFYIKTKLKSFFDKSEIGNLLFGLINYTAAAVGVSYLTESEADKIISESIIPIDSLISECYPTILVKKGKKQQSERRKPNAIRASPLYTKDEMKLIADLTSPIFTELESISKDYVNCVFTSGFAAVRSQIKEVINLRWETLQRFANQTKIRLQDIRKITGEGTIRKASVKPLHVTALLDQTTNPAARLVNELRHILGKNNIITIFSRTFNTVPASEREAWAHIYKKAFNIYMSLGTSKKIPEPVETQDSVDLDESYRKAYNLLSQSQRINGEMISNISLIVTTKYFKLYGRFKQIELLLKGTEKCYKALQALPNSSVDMAVRLYYEGLYSDRLDLNNKQNLRLRKAIDKVRKHLEVTLINEKDEALSKAAALFLQKTEELKTSLSSSIYNS